VQLYAEIEQHHPAMSSRVVFMSGGLLVPEVVRFRDITRNRWVDKPFDAHTIQQTIAEVMAAHDRSRAH
jgi:hypothetical protein